nr:MAG TPA: hypothetical protein [Caudoviricetes sp.]
MFWSSTPRKLIAIWDVYYQQHSGETKEKPKIAYADEIF